MGRVLVATASVHTTAAACDYLGPRLNADDEVVVLAVEEPGMEQRDAGDATNVARSRLFEPGVETAVREGDPAEAIRSLAAERDVDEILLGATSGDPERAGDPPGETVQVVLAGISRPVTVLPCAAPE